MLRFAGTWLLSLLLAACAMVETTSAQPQGKQQNVRTARLYFIWPKSHMLKIGTIDIKIDGQVAGKIGPDSYFFVDRPAGTRTLKVEPPFDFTYFETDVRAAAGGTYYYAIHMKTAYVPLSTGGAVAFSHRNPGTLLPQKGGGMSFATYKLTSMDAASAKAEMKQLERR